jgi:CTP:molybdopterin cytidylyltransferase MocA
MLLSAVIPAAGIYKRNESSQAALSAVGRLAFAGRLVEVFTNFGCNPVVMVVNEDFDPADCPVGGAVIILNRRLDKGRSWSILLGMKYIPEHYTCFIQNVNNPFIQPDLLDKLKETVPFAGYAYPTCRGQAGHPLLLGSEVVNHLRELEELTDFKQTLSTFPGHKVPYEDERILLKLNTPADYRAYLDRNR